MDRNAGVLEVQHGDGELRGFRYIMRHISAINPQTCGPEYMEWLYKKLCTQDYAFDDFSRNRPEVFAANLADPGSMHFEVGDHQGYCVVRNLLYSDNPYIHFCIWDSKLPVREVVAAGNEVLRLLFRKVTSARVTATIPEYNEMAAKLAILLGFRFEGELRDAILYHDRHYKVAIFGITRTDWERRQKGKEA